MPADRFKTVFPRTSPARKLVRLVLNLPEFISTRNLRRVLETARTAGWKTAAAEARRKCWGSGNWYPGIQPPKVSPLKIPEPSLEPLPLSVSVVIPTFNAGHSFGRSLSMLKRQTGFQSLEFICVDSGSTDGTPERARACGAKVLPFDTRPFHHGEARNAGADAAAGNLLLFTVQDALAPSETWLREFYELKRTHACAAASCTEFLPMESDLFYRVQAWKHYRFIGAHGADRISTALNDASPASRQQSAQLSNIALLIDREIFAAHRFRAAYGEDLELGIRLLQSGHPTGFFDSVQIVHHHDRPPEYYLKRGFTDRYMQDQPANSSLDSPAELLTEGEAIRDALRRVPLEKAESFRTVSGALLDAVRLPVLSERVRSAAREILEFLDATGTMFDQNGAQDFKNAFEKAAALHTGTLAAEAALVQEDQAVAARMMEGV